MKKFALVGCGSVGLAHAESMAGAGSLVAVCDVVPDKAAAFGGKVGAKAYSNLDDLLACEKEVELVVICTPNGFHAEHIIKSLQAKKHVLCESPLCLTVAAAWQIIETEKFCRRRLFTVNSAFTHPILPALKKALEEGSFGSVYSFHFHLLWNAPENYFADWRGKVFPGGGLLYTPFSRYVEMLIFLFGEPTLVQGFKGNAASRNNFEVEDTGAVALRMQNGSLGTFHWSVNAPQTGDTALTIITGSGTICLGGEDLMHLQTPGTGMPLLEVPASGETGHLSYSNRPAALLQTTYEQLAHAVDNNSSFFSGAFEGVKTVEAIEKIYKAIS